MGSLNVRVPPFVSSLAIHLAILGSLALVLDAPPGTVSRGVNLEVIESPRLAPAGPTSARRVRPREKIATETPRPQSDASRPPGRAEPVPESAPLTSDASGARRGLPQATEEYLVTRMPELKADHRVPYPAEAKRRGIQGAVIVDLLVDSDGKVRDVQLVQGPGGGLNEAALEAVMKLQFKPALVVDQPVAVRIRYAYRFVLEN